MRSQWTSAGVENNTDRCWTYTAGVTLVDDCVIFSTIQVSYELLTLLAEEPNNWGQKTQSCTHQT